jgi:hypothetical protein
MKKSLLTVWREITKLANGRTGVVVAVKKLVKITGLGESTIRQATKELAEANILKKEARQMPDHRTGRDKQMANEYVILQTYQPSISGGGRGSRSGGQKIISLKTLKDLKNKKEEEQAQPVQSPVVIENQSPKQKAQSETQPASASEARQALGVEIESYAPQVVQSVLKVFESRLRRGFIRLPLQWLRVALKNAQLLFERSGSVPVKKRKPSVNTAKNTYENQKHQRPQVSIIADNGEALSSEQMEHILAKAKAYEKDRQRAV